jgi:hypothetical protein
MFLFSSNGLEQFLQDNSSHFMNDQIYHPQDKHPENAIWVVKQQTPLPFLYLSYLHRDDVGLRPLTFAAEYHLQEVPGKHNNIQILEQIVRVESHFWKDYTESARVMKTLTCGGVPVYKERKSELMTERKMIIWSIPILHEFVYNVYNLKSFAKMKDYQEIDTRSDNWFGRYPEEPEMSLNREFDAVRNRIYKMVPKVPFAFDVPNVKWDKVQYWSTDYTGQKNGNKPIVASTNSVNNSVSPTSKNRQELCVLTHRKVESGTNCAPTAIFILAVGQPIAIA